MENSLQTLSKEELITYQQLFSVFDKEDNGVIPTHQFPLYMRGLGHCPTQSQLKIIKEKLDPNYQGFVQFAPLVQILINRKKQINGEDQLLQAFQALQNQTGSHSDSQKSYKISVTGAKKYLTEFGEALTQAEIQQFQQFLEQNNLKQGIQFNFKDLSKILAYGYIQ